ncbi:TIGR04219 family outer membrane beta-barrel protein [Sessilibacter corallicola]|uniref:TIGR04219 family outer membrane beta-barrel protein n=1 Tax=Sessilibacter corallicola TaxID=2904075 RepID=A0ABQ0A473_9GAMM|nr:TIGR04219 family outer membrane beta-barrel protein [Sessilibacter corallicola]MCE2026927.1 TIGR04219 family outer membrane beta-barrel protein [Sessilibacter corallicola]
MKKQLLISALGLAALSPVLHADTLGIYAGVGSWNPEYSGDIGRSGLDIEDLGFDDDDYSFAYIALEHPIPILPNIKLQRTEMDTDEVATLTETFEFDDITFDVNETVATELDLTHTDAIFYYEVLDNVVSLDLGLNIRTFDGEATVAGETTGVESIDIDASVPMGYAKIQFDLPFTGFYVGADANYVTFEGSTLSDFTVKGGYAYESVIDLGVEVGYRSINLELDDLDDFDTDITIDGIYAALTFHF